MSEEAKMYTCSWCGRPTPNYWEYSHPMAGILVVASPGDILADIFGVRVVCPECKRTFELEITTVRTYRTKRRIEDMPDGWDGGSF